MSTVTLHYIYDPLCGWCYGAAPLLREARRHLPVIAHAGGMMAGSRRQAVTPQLRAYVMAHDRRIAALTGQSFGDAYFDGLLCDPQAVFDSGPPIAAILAAEQAAGRGLDMLARLQTAHYVEGRRIAERSVLLAMAADLGIAAGPFAAALANAEGTAVNDHIRMTQRLMDECGASGFPSFLFVAEGKGQLLDVGHYLGNPSAFAEWLQARLPVDLQGSSGLQCGPDTCEF
jgi:putative protein-disulfide isomerase